MSGSVSLELLYRARPTVVLYRIGRLDLKLGRLFKTAPYISLVNLLAGKELYPEYLTDRCEMTPIAAHVLRWLNDAGAHASVRRELAADPLWAAAEVTTESRYAANGNDSRPGDSRW